jgi:hypothetical protein
MTLEAPDLKWTELLQEMSDNNIGKITEEVMRSALRFSQLSFMLLGGSSLNLSSSWLQPITEANRGGIPSEVLHQEYILNDIPLTGGPSSYVFSQNYLSFGSIDGVHKGVKYTTSGAPEAPTAQRIFRAAWNFQYRDTGLQTYALVVYVIPAEVDDGAGGTRAGVFPGDLRTVGSFPLTDVSQAITYETAESEPKVDSYVYHSAADMILALAPGDFVLPALAHYGPSQAASAMNHDMSIQFSMTSLGSIEDVAFTAGYWSAAGYNSALVDVAQADGISGIVPAISPPLAGGVIGGDSTLPPITSTGNMKFLTAKTGSPGTYHWRDVIHEDPNNPPTGTITVDWANEATIPAQWWANTTNTSIYYFAWATATTGTWTLLGAMVPPRGAAVDGDVLTLGPSGVLWQTPTGAMSFLDTGSLPATAALGDVNIDPATGEVRQWDGAAWVQRMFVSNEVLPSPRADGQILQWETSPAPHWQLVNLDGFLPAAANGDTIVKEAGGWLAKTYKLTSLYDVTGTPTNDQVPTWDSTAGKFAMKNRLPVGTGVPVYKFRATAATAVVGTTMTPDPVLMASVSGGDKWYEYEAVISYAADAVADFQLGTAFTISVGTGAVSNDWMIGSSSGHVVTNGAIASVTLDGFGVTDADRRSMTMRGVVHVDATVTEAELVIMSAEAVAGTGCYIYESSFLKVTPLNNGSVS